jgi:NAD-dependent SIR2 family protein deacetylase
MMRCTSCGGYAHPALAHLHGNPDEPRCYDCTQKELTRRQELEHIEQFLDAWKREVSHSGDGQKAA